MRHRILVVSRDVELRARLARSLSAARYSVDIAESPEHACRIGLRGFGVAVVAPTGLGAEVSELIDKLRAATGRAVLIVGSGSSLDPTQEIVDASDEAALLARVDRSLAPAAKTEEAAPLLHFANYSLDLLGHSLVDEAGQEVCLTRGEFRLLREFVHRPGRVLSRDQLLQASAGRDAETYDRSIDMLIMRLRRKIEFDPKRPRLIVTVPGSGYKFTTQVRSVWNAGPMNGSVAERNDAPAESTPASAERRQITALCAELAPVGSKAADPEDLQTTLDTYRRRTGAIVTQFGGIIGQCIGREVFAYFGHPVAQEDAAERAINAGLALAQNLRGAEISSDLSIRVGIATGVVVADPGGEVIGDAPSDAGRMRSLAEPGQVVLAATTQQLGGRLFTYHAVEPMAPTGVLGPTTAWRVLGRNTSVSRSEALYDGTLAPLVGRAEERNLLLRAWLQAKSGEGRVVLLSGEPGIGKSRLLVELEAWLATETHGSLRYFCSPLHQGSALHPIIARWEQEAGFSLGDTDEQRLCKLESVLAPDELSPTDLALIGGMLGVSTGERYEQPDLSPLRRKELTLAVLQRRLACLAQRHPVLMLFEDAHWADPSSLELLETLVRRITELPILLVISFRPEFVPPWFGRAGVSLVMLTRLDRRQSEVLATQVTGAHPLTPALLERIIAQTDGVPLFIEELTKAMLETAADHSRVAPTVPSTLQASLMARLDRLPAARQVAQIGAVIGREFPFNLLVATAGLSQAQLAEGLDELTAAGLVFRRGLQHEAIYTFKHALVQETAYQSLLKTRRQHIHRQIAEIMRDQLLEQADAEPEIVAHHFTQAGLPALAVEWWGKAGELALARPAYAEALAHLEQALRLADGSGKGSDDKRSRLRLQITYGNALRMARGFGVPETQAAFVVARDLAAAVEDVSERFPAYFGLWNVSFVRGDLIPMQDVAATFLRDVESEPQSPNAAMAHRICGTTLFYEGNFVAARQHLEQVLAVCNAVRDREPVFRFGLDVASPAMTYLALTLWALGRFGRACSLMEEAVARALETGHIPTIALAHDQAAGFEMMRGDRLRTAPHARALLSLAREHGMPVWIANGMFRHGWSRWDADHEAGMAEMRQGIALLRLQQHEASLPTMMTLLAETEAEAGHPDAGLATIEMQLATIERTGQRWPLAQLHRTRGEILLKRGSGDAVAAECAFARAIEIARSQLAKGFELQAAVSLARLWMAKGKRAEAVKLIAPVCAWFGEGLDCDALGEARALQSDLVAK
jgi:DNA-binding response OmpR family regulator/class 3 adenylate cyclase/predicted ATPase